MSTKHTASPWTLTHDERPELGGAFFTVRDSNGGPLAIVLDPDQDSVEDNDVAAAEETIAKLLAAAPTMLDALMNISWSALLSCNCSGRCEGTCSYALVENAIKKATA